MSVSLLMRKIDRLEKALSQCQGPAQVTQVSNLNTSTVAIQVPLSASEALTNLKDEISKSSCKNNPVINEKMAFLTSKISGGKRRTMRSKKRSNKRRSKNLHTRKH